MTDLTLDRIRAVAENRIKNEGKVFLKLIDNRLYTEKIEELKRIATENLAWVALTETHKQEMRREREALLADKNNLEKAPPLFSASSSIPYSDQIDQITKNIDLMKKLDRRRDSLRERIIGLNRRKEKILLCNQQLAELSDQMQRILNELHHCEKDHCHVLTKEELLADKALVCITKYLDGSHYVIDDFVKRGRYGLSDSDKSFRHFSELTAKGIASKAYRKSFSRMISWILWISREDKDSRSCSRPNQYHCIPQDQELFFYTYKLCTKYPVTPIAEDAREFMEDNPLYGCDRGDELAAIHASEAFIEDAPSPFGYGSVSDRRSMHETFCKILLDMGTLEEAVQVATEYPDFMTPSDLVRRIEMALQTRQRGVVGKLLEILANYEAAHPDLPRLKGEMNRLDKIVQLKVSTNFDLESLNQITGAEFEQLIALKFETLGFYVEKTPVTGDYGADLIVVTPNETRVSVQCKRFRNKVNLKAVQEVVASLSHYQCDFGIVVTNSSFLNSAKKLAENNEIELWDQDQLISFLSGDLSFSELHAL